MSALRTILSASGEVMAPDITMWRIRSRVLLDKLVTLVAAVLAVSLIVGYQVLGRRYQVLGRRGSRASSRNH